DLERLPQNATVATGSNRRKYQLQRKRPDLRVVELRGNVPTRLRKFGESEWDGIVLARAGLERLGANGSGEVRTSDGGKFFAHELPADVFVPAGGQGTIALQARASDEEINQMMKTIDHAETHGCLRAEREFLRLL